MGRAEIDRWAESTIVLGYIPDALDQIFARMKEYTDFATTSNAGKNRAEYQRVVEIACAVIKKTYNRKGALILDATIYEDCKEFPQFQLQTMILAGNLLSDPT